VDVAFLKSRILRILSSVILGLLVALQPANTLATTSQRAMQAPLSLPAGIRVMLQLTATITSNPTESTSVSLVTLKDLSIDDLVIVPKGSGASGLVTRKDVRSFSRPGTLDLQVDGIYTIGGELVLPLSAVEHRVGERHCHAEGCVVALVFFPWIKGLHASLPAGTLITAQVSQATTFDRSSVEMVRGMLMRPVASSPAPAAVR
jgi:hypothetical protein